jgi:hypothetical protein
MGYGHRYKKSMDMVRLDLFKSLMKVAISLSMTLIVRSALLTSISAPIDFNRLTNSKVSGSIKRLSHSQ